MNLGTRERWLNDGIRTGDIVFFRGAYLCAGCGFPYGSAAVMPPKTPDEVAEWKALKEPDWPFEQATCPLERCQQRLKSEAALEAARHAGPKGKLP